MSGTEYTHRRRAGGRREEPLVLSPPCKALHVAFTRPKVRAKRGADDRPVGSQLSRGGEAAGQAEGRGLPHPATKQPPSDVCSGPEKAQESVEWGPRLGSGDQRSLREQPLR